MDRVIEPVSVIIPAYNEEGCIRETIDLVAKTLDGEGIEHEIIVVDDGSSDQTYTRALDSAAQVIRHNKNRGYGASLKTGIMSSRYEVIAITDADGTYPIKRIPGLLAQLQSAHMVVGARVKHNASIPLVRRPAKFILRKLAEFVVNDRIPDLNSGLRVFRKRHALEYFNILPDKFSFTTTITVAMLSDGAKVLFVPVDYYKRVGKSKIVMWHFIDFTILILRLSMLFDPLKVFVPVALSCLGAGAAKLALDVSLFALNAESLTLALLREPILSSTTLILLLVGILLLLIGMMADGLGRKMDRRLPQRDLLYKDAEI